MVISGIDAGIRYPRVGVGPPDSPGGGGGTGVWWVWGPRSGSNRSPLRGDHITPQGDIVNSL
jgi:hypothetical protein